MTMGILYLISAKLQTLKEEMYLKEILGWLTLQEGVMQ